ncbi:MAG: hypothetical protein J5621_04515 [Paludibacteraceae bacterium]|nr:hypothetical protein [Paludibacteraceae bacterium]
MRKSFIVFCAILGLALSFSGCLKDKACKVIGHTYAALPIDSTRPTWTFYFDPDGGVVEVGNYYEMDTVRTDLHWLIINDDEIYVYPNDHSYQNPNEIVAFFHYDDDHDMLNLREYYYPGVMERPILFIDGGANCGPRFYRIK